MTDFVSRLAVQALGAAGAVRPRTAGLFEQPSAPQVEVPAADLDAGDAPPAGRSPGRPAATGVPPPREPPPSVSPVEAVVQRHAEPPAAPPAPPAAAATAAGSPPSPAVPPAPLAPAPPAAAEVAEAAAPADARPPGAPAPGPAAASSDPALAAVLEDPPELHGTAAAPWRPPASLVPTAHAAEASPSLAPAGDPPRHPQAPPTVRITIGRVDVRAVTPPRQPAHRPAPRAERPSLVSLSDYLERGTRGQP